MSRYSFGGIYIFSLLFPAQYLVASFNASLVKVCFQLMVQKNASLSTNIIFTVGIMYIVLFCMVFLLFIGAYIFIDQINQMITCGNFLLFSCLYLVSEFIKNIITTLVLIITANNKHKILYSHTIVFCMTAIISTHYFAIMKAWGIYSYPLSIFLSSFISILMLACLSYMKKIPIIIHAQNQHLTFYILKKTILGIKRHFIVFLGILASSYLSGSLGEDAIISFNLIMRIRYIYSIPAISLGISSAMACLPYIGLNNNKVKNIIKISFKIAISYYITIGIILYLSQDIILRIFTKDIVLLTYAKFYYLICVYNVLSFSLCSMYIDFFDTISHKNVAEKIIIIQLLSQTFVWWGLNQFKCELNNYVYAVIISYSITLFFILTKTYRYVGSSQIHVISKSIALK